MIARIQWKEEMGRCWSNGTKFQLCKVSPGDVLSFLKKKKCIPLFLPLLTPATILNCFKRLEDWPLFVLVIALCQNIKFCMCVWTLNTCLLHRCLHRGSAHFFCKGPDSNTLSFSDHKLCCNFATSPWLETLRNTAVFCCSNATNWGKWASTLR